MLTVEERVGAAVTLRARMNEQASVVLPNVYKLSCGARLAKRAVRAAHLVSSPREGARPGLAMGEAHRQPPSASTVC